MADTKLTGLTAITSASLDDLLYLVNDPSGTPASRKITLENLLKTVYVVQSLGTDATTVDAVSARELNIEAATYTASTTLTFSNVANLKTVTMRITNTNANTLTFAGITVKFVADELPSGLSFATNALTFPADLAVNYNVVLFAFDGSTFRGKIEIDG